MTAPLPTPNTRDYSTQSLRSYRGAAASYLKSRENTKSSSPLTSPCVEEQSSSPACGSPPCFRPSHPSRCRSRTPSPPHHPPSSALGSSSKTPRTVSPGGTPASSAGVASRQTASVELEQQEPPPRGLRVHWAEDLVASCYTRPRTLRKDVSALYYSRSDELRFRREAGKILNDECRETDDEGSLPPLPVVEADDERPLPHPPSVSFEQERKDYAISKAVVVFGNSTRTYGGCALEANTTTALNMGATEPTFSFDDAAFWNGALTWS